MLRLAGGAKGQPDDDGDHSAPAEQTNHGGDFCVVVENPEIAEDAKEIVLGKFRVAGGDQRQHLGARVGHVGCGVEPVFEEKEQGENEAGGLAVSKEVGREEEWDEPLENSSSPELERGAEPAKKIVAAFVDDQIGQIDEEHSAVGVQGIEEESGVENEPGDECGTGDRVPGLVEAEVEA